MDGKEWLTSSNPSAMLAHIQDKVSPRKLRLFAVACCYAVWDRLTDPRSRNAVLTAELYADGLATNKELMDARRNALTTSNNIAANEAMHCCQPDAQWAARTIARPEDVCPAATKAAYLRTIIGDPFRPMTLDPHCRTPDVLAIATRIYDTRDWDAMPMLADAMEGAGCEDVRVLEWLRGPPCEYCNGEGMLCGVYSAKLYTTVPLSQARTGRRLTGDPETCKVCSGTGRIKPARCRGDHVLDAILGRE